MYKLYTIIVIVDCRIERKYQSANCSDCLGFVCLFVQILAVLAAATQVIKEHGFNGTDTEYFGVLVRDCWSLAAVQTFRQSPAIKDTCCIRWQSNVYKSTAILFTDGNPRISGQWGGQSSCGILAESSHQTVCVAAHQKPWNSWPELTTTFQPFLLWPTLFTKILRKRLGSIPNSMRLLYLQMVYIRHCFQLYIVPLSRVSVAALRFKFSAAAKILVDTLGAHTDTDTPMLLKFVSECHGNTTEC